MLQRGRSREHARALDARVGGGERFRHAVSVLIHPHIVPPHSFGEAEGAHFLMMELVERAILDRTLPPPRRPERLLARLLT